MQLKTVVSAQVLEASAAQAVAHRMGQSRWRWFLRAQQEQAVVTVQTALGTEAEEWALL